MPLRSTGIATGRRRRVIARMVSMVVLAAMVASGCAASGEEEVVTVTSTAGPAVTAPGLGASSTAPTETTSDLASTVRVSSKPKFGTTDVDPSDPVTVTVFSADIQELTVSGDDGVPVAGTISEDKSTWTLGQRLNYNTTYTFAGTAVAESGERSEISGTLATLRPEKTVRASFQIPSGTTVGVAAPVIITFAEAIDDKAAAQSTFKLTTDKGEIPGSWGWLQDEDIQGTGVEQSIVHFRPATYWPAYTNVHVEANLYGVNYGGGAWGEEDILTDFTIGRKLVVQADVTTFRMLVQIDDQVVRNYAVSYGKDSVPGRATVSGIHVVTEKYPEFEMCNPQFDYCNLKETLGGPDQQQWRIHPREPQDRRRFSASRTCHTGASTWARAMPRTSTTW